MRPQPRYELSIYDGKEITIRVVTQAELEELDFESVDHFHSRCFGLFTFLTRWGKRIQYKGNWPGIGDVGLRVLHAIQENPGVYLSPKDLVELTGWRSLDNSGVLPAQVMRLRNAHHEKGQPRYIKTSRAGGYHIKWPREMTWMTVERLNSTP